MISENEKKKIRELGKKYQAKRIILFGSASKNNNNNNDIDLAVEGVPDRLFFRFYSELILALTKPVDLVDLKNKTMFSDLISAEGVKIYG